LLLIGKFPPKFWFTSGKAVPCFQSDSALFPTVPVTHNPTRKQFFAKMFGLAAAFSIVPKLLAKPFAGVSAAAGASGAAAPVVIRPDPRAVARRAETV
jgi:hypothetical protein